MARLDLPRLRSRHRRETPPQLLPALARQGPLGRRANPPGAPGNSTYLGAGAVAYRTGCGDRCSVAPGHPTEEEAISTRPAGGPDTVVLIHGLWLNGKSWEGWKARYEARGYTVVAESWPGMEGNVSALRDDSSAVEHLGIAEIVDHYAAMPGEPAQDGDAVAGRVPLRVHQHHD